MKRILSLVVVLILYGSFYPWHFYPRLLPANPLWILLHSWIGPVDRSVYRDAVVNVCLYVPFGVFCFLSMREASSAAFRFAVTLAAAVLLSASIEMIQLFDAGRVCSLFDVMCNAAGAAAGIVLAAAFPGAIYGAVSGAEAAGVFRLSGVIGLLYLWAGYQLFPFVPVIGLYTVRANLALLLGPQTRPVRDFFQGPGFFQGLAGWLAACVLLETLVGARRSGRVVAIALLVVPLRILIAHRTLTASEVAGTLAGVFCWMVLRKPEWGRVLAGVLASAALFGAGLVPFEFVDRAQPFTWIPFLPLLQTPWESAFVVLLEKSFLYGSVVWLIRRGGAGWALSTGIVAAALAVIEALQVHLPGRIAEVTDPLLAILMGASLMLLERHAELRGHVCSRSAGTP